MQQTISKGEEFCMRLREIADDIQGSGRAMLDDLHRDMVRYTQEKTRAAQQLGNRRQQDRRPWKS